MSEIEEESMNGLSAEQVKWLVWHMHESIKNSKQFAQESKDKKKQQYWRGCYAEAKEVLNKLNRYGVPVDAIIEAGQ
jgi:hypothetical protein